MISYWYWQRICSQEMQRLRVRSITCKNNLQLEYVHGCCNYMVCILSTRANSILAFEALFISFLLLYTCLIPSSTQVPLCLQPNHSVCEWVSASHQEWFSGLQAPSSLNPARDRQRQAVIEPQTHSASTAGLHETESKQTNDSYARVSFQWEDLKSGCLLAAQG